MYFIAADVTESGISFVTYNKKTCSVTVGVVGEHNHEVEKQ